MSNLRRILSGLPLAPYRNATLGAFDPESRILAARVRCVLMSNELRPFRDEVVTSELLPFYPLSLRLLMPGLWQPLAAPMMYRTAWHVPHFSSELVLKLCLHEEDRKHVAPTLQALDPRGCYLLVAPRLDDPATDLPSMAGLGGSEQTSAGRGVRGRELFEGGEPRAENPLSSTARSGAASEAGQGAACANGSVGGHSSCPKAASSSAPGPGPAPTPMAARGSSSAAGGANGAGAQGPGGSSVGAAAAAGEAARTAKALEVGAAIATALRETATTGCCGRDASKGLGRSGSGRRGGTEARTAASVVPEEMVSPDVEVYVWRGSESHGEWSGTPFCLFVFGPLVLLVSSLSLPLFFSPVVFPPHFFRLYPFLSFFVHLDVFPLTPLFRLPIFSRLSL